MRRWMAVALALACVSCGGSKNNNSPTAPSNTTPPPQTQTTRVIGVSGNLAFGDVEVGQARSLTMTITNTGNAVLTVTGMTVSGGLSAHLSASWTNGQIAPGGSQPVTIEFAPTASGTFSGSVAVNGDQSGGTNSLPISGTAIDRSFAGVWTGNYTVERCDGTGSIQDIFCSNGRGAYPVGTVLPIRLELNQNGNSVSGTVSFGQVRGVVNGTITGGALTLQGSGTSGQITAAISSWSTRVQNRTMTGSVTYNLTYSGLPGTAVVVTRVNLTK